MDYLVYVSLDAENLQFLLWLRDYTRRFEELPDSEAALSPEWKPDGKATAELKSSAYSKMISPGAFVNEKPVTASSKETFSPNTPSKNSFDSDRNGMKTLRVYPQPC